MYLFFLKKNKGEKAPFPTSEIIRQYLTMYGTHDLILMKPGYLSTKTQTIQDFCNNYPCSTNNFILLTSGMNGKNSAQGSTFTISEEHKNDFMQRNVICTLHSCPTDHSKCTLFIECDGLTERAKGCPLTAEEEETLCQALKKMKIRAILIGSSNASRLTYYDQPAVKGECDVFIMNDDFEEAEVTSLYENTVGALQNDGEHPIVLFKEMVGNLSMEEIYRKILAESNL